MEAIRSSGSIRASTRMISTRSWIGAPTTWLKTSRRTFEHYANLSGVPKAALDVCGGGDGFLLGTIQKSSTSI
jgi:hypothetical protein